ncbi:MAG: ribonuclease P protein component [Alphaproteobacteria bacterium]
MDGPAQGAASERRLVSLRKRADFLRAQRGQRAASRGVVVQFVAEDTPAADGMIRFGVTATRKIGGAVVRNRAKRRLRALARSLLRREGRAGGLYVLIARQDTPSRAYDRLQADLRHALRRVHGESPGAERKTARMREGRDGSVDA